MRLKFWQRNRNVPPKKLLRQLNHKPPVVVGSMDDFLVQLVYLGRKPLYDFLLKEVEMSHDLKSRLYRIANYQEKSIRKDPEFKKWLKRQ